MLMPFELLFFLKKKIIVTCKSGVESRKVLSLFDLLFLFKQLN